MKKFASRLASAHARLGTRAQLFTAFSAVLLLTAAVGVFGLLGL